MKIKTHGMQIAAIMAITAIGATGCANSKDGGGSDGGTYPSGAIEFVTAGSPGGGLDLFARQIKLSLKTEGMLKSQMDITNLGGGGGNPTMALARKRAGTDETLIGNSNRVYLNPIMGTTDLTVNKDFVPIAQLMTEYVALVVRKDSPFNSGTEVLDALAKDPGGLKLGVGTVPSDDQIHLLRIAETRQIDPSKLGIVAFNAGGDLMTQLLGDHVDAISTGLSEALAQHKAGKVKILAVSAPERLTGEAADIPTWKEQGVDVVVEHWRGVFGPADMPAKSVKYWENAFAKMVETDAWAKVLEANQWSPLYRNSADFGEVLDEESKTVGRLLERVGLLEK